MVPSLHFPGGNWSIEFNDDTIGRLYLFRKDSRIAIIGAGITGLTLAYELCRRGLKVELFEAGSVVGGELAVVKVGGEPLERYYHHLFRGDNEIIGLLKELGMSSKLEWGKPSMGFFSDGILYPFSNPVDLVRFGAISISERLRMGLATKRLQRISDYREFEDVKAAEYLPGLVGNEAFEIVWKPLLRAKFGDHWRDISMAWFWGRVHVRFKSRDRLGFREKLAYIRGSFRQITLALEQYVRERGVLVHLSSQVERISVEQNHIKGIRVRGQDLKFDTVIGTVGLPILRGLLGSHTISQDYGAIAYRGALVLLMSLRESVSPYYWTNVGDVDLPFAGLIDHSGFIDASRYGGRHPMYVSNYLDPSHRYFDMTSDELLDEYEPHIKNVFPKFDRSLIEEIWVSADKVAQPVIKAGYQRRIPPYRSTLKGLFVCNTSQIYPEDRGTNYNVRIARECVQEILNS
tara:strand:- start:1888 stop:3270 length:1383 start_codon:yes stop_codon:yes gene_type:complete